MIGILEHIDGRKLTIGATANTFDGGYKITGPQFVYLRKGFDANALLPLLQSEVEVSVVEEKGFQMVEAILAASAASQFIKAGATDGAVIHVPPSLPKTEVEKTKPVDMSPSANVPKLNFGRAESFTGVVGDDTNTVKMTVKVDNRSQKDHDIMRQWAMGATLNSPALAQANDALALSTQQTIERAKRVAEELLKWVVER